MALYDVAIYARRRMFVARRYRIDDAGLENNVVPSSKCRPKIWCYSIKCGRQMQS